MSHWRAADTSTQVRSAAAFELRLFGKVVTIYHYIQCPTPIGYSYLGCSDCAAYSDLIPLDEILLVHELWPSL